MIDRDFEESNTTDENESICYFDQNVFISCMYISVTICYIRYLRLASTAVFNSKGKCLIIFVSQGTSFYKCKLGDII